MNKGISIKNLITGWIIFLVAMSWAEDIWNTASFQDRLPRIDPNYSGIIIPPNIAPLNFVIKETGRDFAVRISSNQGGPIVVQSKDGKIPIKMKAWKNLLSQNKDQSLYMDVAVKDANGWTRFKQIENKVAPELIDPYMAYRLIGPVYALWTNMGLYQRNLETYDEYPIMLNRLTNANCMNCHNFKSNNPDCMIMHFRGGPSGMLLKWNGELRIVNTATDFNKAGAYPSWHPNGNIIALSVNKLSMFFHAKGESRDVMDYKSDLILYLIDRNMVTTCPEIASDDRMETLPSWSPDGRHLYFCATDQINANFTHEEFPWDKIKYDLMRIGYDAETGSWGELETVLTAEQVEGSITFPRISPDGRYVLFTKADYGNFPIHLKSADLYSLDLTTGTYHKLACNSDQTDSFHSWSSNGRWFVFSSRRRDGFLSRPYFCYFNRKGLVSKPVLMPQKDPSFYDTFIKNYNVPEMMQAKVEVDPRGWRQVALEKKRMLKAKLDPAVKGRGQKQSGPDLFYEKPPWTKP